MNNSILIAQIIAAAKKSGLYLVQSSAKINYADVEVKGLNDFVTFVDKGSECILLEELNKIIHGSSFIAEESGSINNNSEWTWIIDPLDGTTNYIHHIPIYCVSIALMKNTSLYAAVIYNPNADEVFHAVAGEGAFLNDKKIHVTGISKMKDSIWTTGFPIGSNSNIDKYMNFVYYSMLNTHGLRRLGSAAIDMAYVAAGRVDGYFKMGIKPWDMAAGALLIQEAGGVVTDFAGESHFIAKNEVIACNKNIFIEFYDIFKNIFYKNL